MTQEEMIAHLKQVELEIKEIRAAKHDQNHHVSAVIDELRIDVIEQSNKINSHSKNIDLIERAMIENQKDISIMSKSMSRMEAGFEQIKMLVEYVTKDQGKDIAAVADKFEKFRRRHEEKLEKLEGSINKIFRWGAYWTGVLVVVQYFVIKYAMPVIFKTN